MVVNPFLPLNEYIPDGEAHVFGDRVYLYGSHDKFDGDYYCMNDYVCYSANIKDLTQWRWEGVIYKKGQDPRNQDNIHCLWAPDVVVGPDGRYYLYYCLDVLPEIGVAVCDTPAGKYEYLGLIQYADGTPLGRRKDDYIQFDPAVFTEDEKHIYLFSGNGPRYRKDINHKKNSQVMQLHADMITIKQEAKTLIPTLASSQGTSFMGHEFFEASSIRKIGNKYYFIYSDVQSFTLCYATSDVPDQGYEFGGQLVALGDVGYRGRSIEDAQNFLGNTHGTVETINGQWYVFYHRHTNGTKFSRQACAEKLEILPDGTIPQVEMTSCGLNNGPLEARGTYSSVIACNLWSAEGVVDVSAGSLDERHPYFTQTGVDGELDTTPYIANMRHGSVAGYKYFCFQGIQEIGVVVQGGAKGRLLILTEPDAGLVGYIDIDADRLIKSEFYGKIQFSDGISALYFKYQGTGAFDFFTFIFR